MKKYIYGLTVKLLIISVGFGAILTADAIRQDDKPFLGASISEKVKPYLASLLGRPQTTFVTADQSVPKSMVPKPEIVPFTLGTPPVVPDKCKVASSGEDRVVIGDQMKLRFFETAASTKGNGAVGANQHAGKIAFERLDLSGAYTVGQDGAVSVPLLGRINVVGQSLDCVERVLAHESYGFAPIETRVSAGFIARPAVIVQGDLQSPGRYDYAPGMTVEQLLAFAGAPILGARRAAVSNAPYLTARKSELERSMMSNLVKWQRIRAALDGEATLQLSDTQMTAAVDLLGSQRIDAELIALVTDIEAMNAAEIQLQIQLGKIGQLIDAKTKHLALIEEQVDVVRDRHSGFIKLQERGIIPMVKLTESEVLKMSMERMLVEAKSGIIELQTREVELGSEIELQRTRERRRLAMELRNITEEADGLQGQLHAVNDQLDIGSDDVSTHIFVKIDRLGPKGSISFEASPDTRVLPGDTVRVVVATGPSQEWLARSIYDESQNIKVE